MSHQTRQDGLRATERSGPGERDAPHRREPRGASHVLTPIRVLTAVAPSGGEITFLKFSESDRELSWYQGQLSATEDMQFWRAKLRAERPGLDKWSEARAILTRNGWRIVEETP